MAKPCIEPSTSTEKVTDETSTMTSTEKDADVDAGEEGSTPTSTPGAPNPYPSMEPSNETTDEPAVTVEKVECPAQKQKGNSCAGHSVHFVVSRKIATSGKAIPAFEHFDPNKHLNKTGNWIEDELKKLLGTAESSCWTVCV